MPTVILRFTTKWPPNITSPIIAVLSGSERWSHTMLVHGGVAYEATMTHGCRKVQEGEAMRDVAFFCDMHICVPDLAACLKFGDEQHGKGYDYAGALGLPFLASDDWGDDSKWWCSELNFAQIGAGGVWLLDKEVQCRVTPQHLFMLNYPKSQIVDLT